MADFVSVAERLKAYHRHLRDALQHATLSLSTVDVATSSDTDSSTSSTARCCFDDELRAWRLLVRADAEQSRLQNYADDMHLLASSHWAACAVSRACDPVVCADAPARRHATPSQLFATTTSRLPPKAAHEDCSLACKTTAFVEHCSSDSEAYALRCTDRSNSGVGCDAATDVVVGMHAPRRFDDRVRLCLECIRDYFIGVPTVSEVASCVSPTRKRCRATECDVQCTLDTVNGALRSLCVGRDTNLPCDDADADMDGAMSTKPSPLFRLLPTIFARTLKPLRRLFYAKRSRTATALEVEAMLLSLPCVREGCVSDSLHSCCGAKDTVNCLTCRSELTSAHGGCGAGACLSRTALHTAAAYVRALCRARRRGCSDDDEHDAFTGNGAASAVCGVGALSMNTCPPICILDVGSCYGPFYGLSLSDALRGDIALHVVAIDLQPYNDVDVIHKDSKVHMATCEASVSMSTSDATCAPLSYPRVWKGDWLDVSFFTTTQIHANVAPDTFIVEDGLLRVRRRQQAQHTSSEQNNRCSCCDGGGVSVDGTLKASAAVSAAELSSASHLPTYEVDGVAAASFDVVVFCLLLSFLPSARLRYLACLHAYVALREGGLLIIVSTRTQNSRKSDWVRAWSACICDIGFARVHTVVRSQLLVLSFAKCAASAPPSSTQPSAETSESVAVAPSLQAWLRCMLSTDAANHGLRTGADERT